MRGHQRSDGLLADYCDVSVYKLHPLFSQNNQGLQIIAYYDDVEVCNPLGSKAKKHKLGNWGCNIFTPKLMHMFLTHSFILLYTWKHFSSVPVDNEMYSVVSSYEIFCVRRMVQHVY
jgi:hypothetical protein